MKNDISNTLVAATVLGAVETVVAVIRAGGGGRSSREKRRSAK